MASNNHNQSSENSHESNGAYNSYNGLQPNGQVPEQNEDVVDLRQIFYTLANHKWIIAGTVLFCVILAGIIAAITTPIYRSHGSIMITEAENQYSYAGSDLGSLLSTTYGIGQGSTIINELLILRSRNLSMEIADAVIEERYMVNGRQFPVLFVDYPDDFTMASKELIASRLRDNLEYSRVEPNGNLVNIAYNSPSPLEAAYVANTTMELYSNLSTEQNRKSASAAVQFLEEERTSIREDLRTSEELLRTFMNTEDLVQVSAQTNVLIERMAELEAKKQSARVQLVTTNSAIDQFTQRLSNIKPGLASQFTDAIGPEMERLQFSLAELKIEKTLLLSNNPNIGNREEPPQELVTLNNQIAVFDQQIQDLTQELIISSEQTGFMAASGANIAETIGRINQKLIELMVNKQQFQAQIETIDEQLEQQQQFFQGLPDNMMDLARLERNMAINEELFLTVSEQYAEMSLWQQTQFGLGQIIDRPFVPSSPVAPNIILYLLVGLVLGSIIGVGYVFTKETLNTKIDSVEKLKAVGLPLLTVIPTLNSYIKREQNGEDTVTAHGVEISSQLVTAYDTISPISESYRRLESNILHANPDADLKTLMVTSTTKGEGKTTIIGNLGIIMAETEQKVVIVETDLRRSHIHNLFGINNSPGIMDVLFKNTPLEQAIQQTVIPNLHLLAAGYEPSNPGAAIKSAAFLNTINELKNRYDYVLLDTAPYGIITDASSLMEESDGIIVAAKFNKTSQVQLRHTLEELNSINANVIGTVMTHFDYKKSNDYSYGSGYYKEKYEDYRAYEA